jgi:hypothetical protein
LPPELAVLKAVSRNATKTPMTMPFKIKLFFKKNYLIFKIQFLNNLILKLQPSTSTGNGESSEQQNTMEDESESSSDEEFDENKPPKNPSGNPNALPPFKDPMLVSPMKSGLPPRLPTFTTENTNNSTNDGMDIE